jgi:hypothetical protein
MNKNELTVIRTNIIGLLAVADEGTLAPGLLTGSKNNILSQNGRRFVTVAQGWFGYFEQRYGTVIWRKFNAI